MGAIAQGPVPPHHRCCETLCEGQMVGIKDILESPISVATWGMASKTAVLGIMDTYFLLVPWFGLWQERPSGQDSPMT